MDHGNRVKFSLVSGFTARWNRNEYRAPGTYQCKGNDIFRIIGKNAAAGGNTRRMDETYQGRGKTRKKLRYNRTNNFDTSIRSERYFP